MPGPSSERIFGFYTSGLILDAPVRSPGTKSGDPFGNPPYSEERSVMSQYLARGNGVYFSKR
jgi:hypothetical protein